MADKQYLSILGFYNYDASIFDNLELPANIDKSLVIDNILLDNAELSLVYTDFEFMKYAIGSWSRSESAIWDRLNKAFNEEYNPLWNVDEDTTETRTIDRHGTDSKDVKGSNQNNTNLTVTDNSTTTTTNSTDLDSTTTTTNSTNLDSTTTNSIKGFNSDNWADHDKSVVDSSQSDTGSNVLSSTQSDKGSNVLSSTQSNVGVVSGTDASNEEGSHAETITETFNRKRGGNIGVTMSQQLLQAELDTRPKLNIYKYISKSFKKRFCNMIY